QTNRPTLRAMGSSDGTGHAIVGLAPSTPDSGTEDNLNLIFSIFSLDYTIDGIMGGDGEHDTIVPLLSQIGGIIANAYTTVDGIVHAGAERDFWSPDDIDETASQVVFSRALTLLKEPVSSDLFSGFSALSGGGNYTSPYECPNTKDTQSIKTSQATINFTPAEGAIVAPGDTVQVQFDITNGEPVSGVLFSFNGEFRSINGPPPYSFEITAPANKAGRINIYAQTIGSGSEDYGVDSHIIVQPGQAAVSLTATPFEINFTQPGRSLPLHVIAKYSDETEIDISSGVAGTTYATQSGTENIISVNSDGVINAVATGEDDILISNSGQTVSVPVYVSTELKQEKVFANGFE
ncbi:MAG: hypothetical protein L3J52_08100, partial [Proteobacteria bacterium]|nr:hypothetical protein [Pseudomonadota bacterium]